MSFVNMAFNISKLGKYIRAIRFALRYSFKFEIRSFEFGFEFEASLDFYSNSTSKIHFWICCSSPNKKVRLPLVVLNLVRSFVSNFL